MFVGDCCFSLCVKKGGMFEKKTLSIFLSTLLSLYRSITNRMKIVVRIGLATNMPESTHTHVGNKLENKKWKIWGMLHSS